MQHGLTGFSAVLLVSHPPPRMSLSQFSQLIWQYVCKLRCTARCRKFTACMQLRHIATNCKAWTHQAAAPP